MLMTGVTSIAAGATNNNVLSGLAYEFAPFNARINFGLVGDAAGELRATVTTGTNVIMQESSLSRAARVPIKPDDFLLSDVVRKGERITVQSRNTGAGANNLFWAVEMLPLGR
jgi:hypothetical protein